MEKIYPKRIEGKFDLGFVLSYYSLPLLGGRSSLGEKLYQFKYQKKREQLSDIVEAVLRFVEENKFYGGEFYYADMIIGMPPSDENKEWQSARMLATVVGEKLEKFVAKYTLRKLKSTPELKDTLDKKKRSCEEKAEIIKNTFGFTTEKAKNLIKGKQIFLIDDVYDTGATADEVAQFLKQEGQAKKVYFLAVTRTQS